MDTTTTAIVVLTAIGLLIVGALLGVVLARRERTKRLQAQFGPEYDRAVNVLGDQAAAEKELHARLQHVKSLEILPLSDEQMERFAQDWRITQAKFVEQPVTALQEADHLIGEVMEAKGYPVQDFEARAADISVDYPGLALDYRRMRDLVARSQAEDVNTEDLRQAMIHCRALFEGLLGLPVGLAAPEEETV